MNDNAQTTPDRAPPLSGDDLEAILTAPERLMATALHAERRAQQAQSTGGADGRSQRAVPPSHPLVPPLIDADLPAAAGDWLGVALRARRLADAWTPAAP